MYSIKVQSLKIAKQCLKQRYPEDCMHFLNIAVVAVAATNSTWA